MPHHGGTGRLPGRGPALLFRSVQSLAGRPGGAGRPGVAQRLLPVRAGSAAVPGDRRIHRHGHLHSHRFGLLLLPALEECNAAARQGKGLKEEEQEEVGIIDCRLLCVWKR